MKITSIQARLCFRVIVEVLARKRCGEDLKGLATHCDLSTKEIDTIIDAAKTEGLTDPSGRLIDHDQNHFG